MQFRQMVAIPMIVMLLVAATSHGQPGEQADQAVAVTVADKPAAR